MPLSVGLSLQPAGDRAYALPTLAHTGLAGSGAGDRSVQGWPTDSSISSCSWLLPLLADEPEVESQARVSPLPPEPPVGPAKGPLRVGYGADEVSHLRRFQPWEHGVMAVLLVLSHRPSSSRIGQVLRAQA